MSRFVFQTDNEKETYFLDVAKWMTLVFGITDDEAIGRINQWARHAMRFIASELVYHDSVGGLAITIYFGNSLRLEDLVDPPLPVRYLEPTPSEFTRLCA